MKSIVITPCTSCNGRGFITNKDGGTDPCIPCSMIGSTSEFMELTDAPEHFIPYQSIVPSMSKREYYAGLAMQGYLSNSNAYSKTNTFCADVIHDSVMMADLLIEELNKEKEAQP